MLSLGGFLLTSEILIELQAESFDTIWVICPTHLIMMLLP